MKKLIVCIALLLGGSALVLLAQQVTKVYFDYGGDKMVVASGGEIEVQSGGVLDVESGGALKFAGTTFATTDYVPVTKAGQQSITASGAGNDVTLVAADDVLLTPGDDFTVTPTAGSSTLNGVGAGEDVNLVAADDVVVTPTDAFQVSGASATINAGGATIEFSVGAGNFVMAGTIEELSANITVADDAGGTKPAGAIPITAPIATCTCNDATGCTMSVAEPTPTAGYGRRLTILSVGTGNCEFADSAGVIELSGALVLEPTSTLELVYHNAAWHQVAVTDNVP